MKLNFCFRDYQLHYYRPFIHLEEENEIEEFRYDDHRLWRSNPLEFLKKIWKRREWKWLVSISNYDKSIVPYYILSKIGKDTIFFTSHIDWDKSVGGDMPYGRMFWKSYLKSKNTTIVAVTDEASEGMRDVMGFEADEIIPHPVDTDKFYPRNVDESEKPVALFVGRFAPEKNVGFMLELAKNSPEYDFWICGDGDEREKVEEAEDELDNLDYKGYIDDDEKLAEYYNKASVLLLPSLRMGAVTENFGCVIIESLACETPVIAYDLAGPKSILEDVGGLVPYEDEEKFEKKLNSLIEDEEKLQNMGEEGRDMVEEKYDIEKVSQKWMRILGNY